MTRVFACSATRVSPDEARIRTMITSLAGVAAPRWVGRRDNLTRGNVGRIKDWGGTGGETVYPPITCTLLVQPHRRHEALGRKTLAVFTLGNHVCERSDRWRHKKRWPDKINSEVWSALASQAGHFDLPIKILTVSDIPPPIRPFLTFSPLFDRNYCQLAHAQTGEGREKGKNIPVHIQARLFHVLWAKKKNIICLKYGVSRRQ